jgi:anti-anti-sigma factor
MSVQTLATRQKPERNIEFRVERRPHYLRVAIRGEASFDQAEALSTQLLRVPLDGASLVVFDLAGLTFLSSLAIGALIEYRRRVGRRGVDVRLANVQPPVWLALESAGLGRLFERIDLEEPT